jgi:hypothetical protein
MELINTNQNQVFSFASIINQKISHEAFLQLSGKAASISFVKVVVDRHQKTIHFLNHHYYQFHSDYIAEKILNLMSREEVDQKIDKYNFDFYLSEDRERRFFLGVIGFHQALDRKFYTLETVEIDNMSAEMIKQFYTFTAYYLDSSIPFYFKPASHEQEAKIKSIDSNIVPRIFNYEIFSSSHFIPLHAGEAKGRLRIFTSDAHYKQNKSSIEWFDIIVMPRVPDDIPRVAGIINSTHTTPLSHTNVLATGWNIPNAIQIGILDTLINKGMDGAWVYYKVDPNLDSIILEKIENQNEVLSVKPTWTIHAVRIETPEIQNTPIAKLSDLRMSSRFKYGTKAANLGEIFYLLENGSDKLLGYYRVKRPPRKNLLPHLCKLVGIQETEDLNLINNACLEFIKNTIVIPNGLAIPFSIQQTVLEKNAKVQQLIGKLKMALELNLKEIDALCLQLQQQIRNTRIPDDVQDEIDSMVATELCGTKMFVVRSSSNAEDLENFSAAGLYESVVHVKTRDQLFQAIKDVWASLCSPRSVRLLHQAGISLDDCYMGVIIQEEIETKLGGVMVTTNPTMPSDFRNVYINASNKSVTNVVQGTEMPYQFLFNTVEGSGKTLSLGDANVDLPENIKLLLQDLAIVGRLLQAHFSLDYSFAHPLDIEWVLTEDENREPKICLVQLRPYAV